MGPLFPPNYSQNSPVAHPWKLDLSHALVDIMPSMYDTILKEARRHLVVYAPKNILSGVKEAVYTKPLCIVNCNTKGYILTKFEAN